MLGSCAAVMALVRRGRDACRCQLRQLPYRHTPLQLSLSCLGSAGWRSMLSSCAADGPCGRDACRCSCVSFRIDTRCSSRLHAWAAQAGARCSALAQLMALVRRGRDARRCSCDSFHIDTCRCSSCSHAWAAQAGARCSALAQLMALVRRGRDACRCSCISFHIDTRCSMLSPSSLGWQHAPVAALLVHSCVVSNLALTSLRL